MPTGRHVPKRAKIAVTGGVLIAIILGIMVALGAFNDSKEPAGNGNGSENGGTTTTPAFTPPAATDVIRVGYLTFDTPGLKQDTMHLVYEEPGKPALTSEIIIDEHTYCSPGGSGGVLCMAMSVQYSSAFGGKRAIVEGNTEGDDIRARFIQVIEGEIPPVVGEPGRVFIPWIQARNLILACEVSMLVQLHSGTVDVTLKDGTKYVALQPVIDEVFSVANEAQATCGTIPLATE